MQIILHIGQQKTASSTIQAYLAQNRKQFAAQKMLYPTALGNRKANFISGVVTEDESLVSLRKQILAKMDAEFSGDYDKAIVSNENLFASGNSVLTRLKRTLEPYATSWRVLCYVRRPDEHIVSQYQQKIKGGHTETFDEFYKERLSDDTYNYENHLKLWSDVFGQDAVEVRLFHRKALRGSPIDDFVQWVGANPSGLSAPAVQTKNESLDPINTEIVRFLNICEAEHPDLIRKHNVRRLMARLRALDSGERARLDSRRARLLLDRFREDHERLAEHYLSSEDASFLLAPPDEVPLQPPLNRETLFDRMMTLFADRDLAQRAVEAAVGESRGSGSDRPRKKGTRAERALQRHERQERRRTWYARAHWLIRSYWRSAASWVRPGPR